MALAYLIRTLVLCSTFCATAAFIPAARVPQRACHIATLEPGSSARGRSTVRMEFKKEPVKLDEEMVKVVAAAASPDVDAQQERIDAALAELGRSGNLASAAVAGGFFDPGSDPIEQLPEDVVPVWLTVAPPVIGGLSVVLFVLNTFGVFGEGPDLTTLT